MFSSNLMRTCITKNEKQEVYMKKKINQIREVESLDIETGEIQTVITDTSFQIQAEPAFIKLYLADILYLNDLQTNQASLLFALLQKMNYDNEIVLNASLKRQIAEKLNVTVGTLDNNLSKFCKGKILKRQDRGIYIANPNLFGKGQWHQIAQSRTANVDMTINYTEDGRTFKAVLQEQEAKEKEAKKTEVNKTESKSNSASKAS